MLGLSLCTTARAFTHPGIPLTTQDLDTVKANLNREPWKSGYAALAGDSHSQLSYTMQGPFAHVGRNEGGTYPNLNQWRNDMIAVWNLARMWYFTQDTRYAQKSHDILLAWATTQTSFGGIESGLDLGDYAYRYAGGADILRGTWPEWTQADTDAVKNLFANVYWNSTSLVSDELGPTNKGSLNLAAGLAVAVFCDDQAKFDKVVYQLRAFPSTGFQNTLTNGEHGETGRDQGHSYAHLLQTSFISEVLWKQGVDVFSERDNRLLAMGEYYGRFNLNVPTPFVSMGTTDEYLPLDLGLARLRGGTHGLQHPQECLCAAQGPERPVFGAEAGAPRREHGLLHVPEVGRQLDGDAPGGDYMAKCEPGGHGNDEREHQWRVGQRHLQQWRVDGVGRGRRDLDARLRPIPLSLQAGHRRLHAHREGRVRAIHRKHGQGRCDDPLGPQPHFGVQGVGGHPAGQPRGNLFPRLVEEMYGGSNWEAQSYWLPQSAWWVKVERLGNIVTTYASPDGTSWATQAVGRCENLGASPYLGICVTSMVPGTPCTATFSNVSITGGTGGLVTIPPAPCAVYASPGAGQVPLRWLESFGATSYNVLRATTSGGPYTTIASGVTNASHVDASVVSNTTYFYVITASNSAGTSPNSPEETVTTQPPPVAPTELIALAGNAQATLVWIGFSGASSYNVKRSTTDGGGHVTVANVSGASFTDTGLANETTYYYLVSAVSAAGEGENSSQVSVTPVASAPTTLFWSGSVSGTWDTATTNWSGGGGGTTFQDGNAVVFDDSGYANTTISLSAARSIGGIIVNNVSTSYTLGGSAISGTGGLLKQGGGSLTLNGANTYSGGTTLAGGTLTVGNSSALGTGELTMGGGTLANSGNFGLANDIVVSGTGDAIRLGAAANFTLNGGISGNGALTLGNSGYIASTYLSGANSMSGGTITIANNSNYVRFSSPSAGNANADWVLNNTQAGRTTLDFASGTISFGSLSGSGFIQGNVNGANSMNVTISVGGNNHSTTFGGVIHNNGWGTGPIGLTKIGSGMLTLTGANDYSGETNVNAGELLISTASLASGDYSVADGATLGVNNTSSGSAPTSNLTLSAGSTLEFQGVSSTTTPLIAAGNVTVNGSCAVKITGTSGLLVGNTYPLLSYSGQFQGALANLQLQLPAGVTAMLVNSDNQIALSVTAATTPAAPATLAATAGNGQVVLSWTASSGATSYNVKRATTSGGPYTTIATVSGTSYTDSGLADGATWYYTVSAQGLAGKGAASSPVSATTYTAVENWRQTNFGTISNSGNTADGADPDGDGWINAQEFTSGTDPNDRTSLLKISQMTPDGNDMTLGFLTVLGKTYRLERSDTLQNGSWQTVQNNIAGTGGTVQIIDPDGTAQPNRFYRIVVTP